MHTYHRDTHVYRVSVTEKLDDALHYLEMFLSIKSQENTAETITLIDQLTPQRQKW